MPELTPISVTVTRVEGEPSIVSSHPLPSNESVIACLPYKLQTRARRISYLPLNRIIRRLEHQVTNQQWATAIMKAIDANENLNNPGSAEVNGTPVAMMVIGDTIYEMSPIKIIPPSQALALARRTIAQDAKTKGDALVSAAKITAAGLIEAANAERKKYEALIQKMEGEKVQHPPAWVAQNGIICRRRRQVWEVGVDVKISITHFDLTYFSTPLQIRKTRTWKALGAEAGVRVRLWVPIQSTFAISSTFVDTYSPELPHISHSSACLAPGDAPSQLESLSDYAQLSNSIQRCMGRVQLNSLLVSVADWLPTFMKFVPPDLLNALSKRHEVDDATSLAQQMDLAEKKVAEAALLVKAETGAGESVEPLPAFLPIPALPPVEEDEEDEEEEDEDEEDDGEDEEDRDDADALDEEVTDVLEQDRIEAEVGNEGA